MKPVDKTDAVTQEQYARLDGVAIADEQYKRDEKRVWKKARTRHLRNFAKRELQEMVKELGR